MSKIKWARPPVGGPIIIPNCAMGVIVWTASGETLHNVLHFSLIPAGPLNPSVAETIFSALKANAATTAWLAKIHPSYSLAGIRVKDLRAGNNPVLASTGVAIPGTSAASNMPTSAALVVTQRTAYSGRGFFGRSYLPGLASDQLSDARHYLTTGAFDTAAINFMNAINAAFSPNIGPWVLGQRALKASPDPNAPPPYNSPRPANTIPIQSVVVTDHRVDSQRKRLGRL